MLYVMILLSSFDSSHGRMECKACCETLFLERTYYSLQTHQYRGNCRLKITCAKKKMKSAPCNPRKCDLMSEKVHEFHMTSCSADELLIFLSDYQKISNPTEVLEFHSPTKDELVFKLSQNLLSKFPHLKRNWFWMKTTTYHLYLPKSLSKMATLTTSKSTKINV